MPYVPISPFMPATEDIRLQHRFRIVAEELARETHFSKLETLRLLHIHYYMTTKKKKVMDRQCFVVFMDVFLGCRNVDGVAKMHMLSCKKNKTHLTGREFVGLLSMLLRGKLPETTRFYFAVFTEIFKSPMYIRKEDVIQITRKNNTLISNSDCRYIADYVIEVMDKDRDMKISYEEYRNAVEENVVWLQFLGPILPSRIAKEVFFKLFSSRPYTDNIELCTIERPKATHLAAHAMATPGDRSNRLRIKKYIDTTDFPFHRYNIKHNVLCIFNLLNILRFFMIIFK